MTIGCTTLENFEAVAALRPDSVPVPPAATDRILTEDHMGMFYVTPLPQTVNQRLKGPYLDLRLPLSNPLLFMAGHPITRMLKDILDAADMGNHSILIGSSGCGKVCVYFYSSQVGIH